MQFFLIKEFTDKVLLPKIMFVCPVEIHGIAYIVDANVSRGRSEPLDGKVIVSSFLTII